MALTITGKQSIKNCFSRHKLLFFSVIIALVFYLWVAAQIPYTHDDWDWGLHIGMQHLLKADINSRYVGNLIEVILTRNSEIKTIVMGVVFMSVPLMASFLGGSLAESKDNSESNNANDVDFLQTFLFFFSNSILLLLHRNVWRETNGWVAGFSNYVVSGLLLLVLFYFLGTCEKTLQKTEPSNRQKMAEIISVFIYGVIIQLFLENLSVFIFAFSILFLIVNRNSYVARRCLIPLTLGTLLGLVIMFSSNIYPTLLDTGYAISGYRELMYDPSLPLHVFIIDSLHRFLGDYLPRIMWYAGILLGVISGLMAIIAIIKRKDIKKLFLYVAIVNTVFCFYYLYYFFRDSSIVVLLTKVVPINPRKAIEVIDLVYVLIIFTEILLLFQDDKKLQFWLSALWLSPFFIIAPMIIVNTVGPRIFYTTYICFLAFSNAILYWVISRIQKKATICFFCICTIAAFLLGNRWVQIYKPIGEQIRVREAIIEKAIEDGSREIVFSDYSNKQYLWHPDPSTLDRVSDYKKFYNIPEEIDIRFESWENP